MFVSVVFVYFWFVVAFVLVVLRLGLVVFRFVHCLFCLLVCLFGWVALILSLI